jgi:hypothetical protein
MGQAETSRRAAALATWAARGPPRRSAARGRHALAGRAAATPQGRGRASTPLSRDRAEAAPTQGPRARAGDAPGRARAGAAPAQGPRARAGDAPGRARAGAAPAQGPRARAGDAPGRASGRGHSSAPGSCARGGAWCSWAARRLGEESREEREVGAREREIGGGREGAEVGGAGDQGHARLGLG